MKRSEMAAQIMCARIAAGREDGGFFRHFELADEFLAYAKAQRKPKATIGGVAVGDTFTTKRVRFTNPIAPTDKFQVEVSTDPPGTIEPTWKAAAKEQEKACTKPSTETSRDKLSTEPAKPCEHDYGPWVDESKDRLTSTCTKCGVLLRIIKTEPAQPKAREFWVKEDESHIALRHHVPLGKGWVLVRVIE